MKFSRSSTQREGAFGWILLIEVVDVGTSCVQESFNRNPMNSPTDISPCESGAEDKAKIQRKVKLKEPCTENVLFIDFEITVKLL